MGCDDAASLEKIRMAADSARLTESVVVVPGDTITRESGYLRGHGTFVDDGYLVANVAGQVERVNKLVSVRPISARYSGEVGDVVVGRVKEVGSRRWKVDINARQDAVLMLSSINLTGGVQRRRTVEDQMQMRSFFAEGDLLSADVHSFMGDGAIMLHARSLKYGKLENGQFVAVPPSLVKRLKQHFVSLPSGVDVIVGKNGYLWIAPTVSEEELADAVGGDRSLATSTLATALEARRRLTAEKFHDAPTRLRIARVYNAVRSLAAVRLPITPTTIHTVFQASEALELRPPAMLEPATMLRVTAPVARILDTASMPERSDRDGQEEEAMDLAEEGET